MRDNKLREFEFKQCLGRGGFGEVYLAKMTAPSGLSSTVAVKVLHAGLDPRGQGIRRLTDEGRILSMLNHPAIVGVHDLAVLDGRIALITEYVEGADLDVCLLTDDPMPRGALYETMAVVADALQAAHQALDTDGNPLGLLHRDVKPGNIRIGRHGQVKLLDFGIATASGLDREAKTGTNALVGSFAYMPPERFRRTEVGPPADFYSLGCTLYECLSGELLFEQEDMAAMMMLKAMPDETEAWYDQAFAKLTDVPDEAIALIRATVATDPSQRPTGPELVAALEDLAGKTGGPRLNRWARNRQWPDVAAEPGSLTGTRLTDTTTPAGTRTAAPSSETIEYIPEPPPPQPSRLVPMLLVAVVALLCFVVAVGAGGTIAYGMSRYAATTVPVVDEPARDVTPETPVPGTPDVEPTQPTPRTQPAPSDTLPEPSGTQPAPSGTQPAPSGTLPPTDAEDPTPTDPGADEPGSDEPDPADATAAVDPTGLDEQDALDAPLTLEHCGALSDLELQAATGRLVGEAAACLGDTMRDSRLRIVDRRKLARIVLVQALAACQAGDCALYEEAQPYYFEELDRSDPEMMYAWAEHQEKRGNHAQVLLWSERALERRSQWSNLTHVKRVDALRRMRANASYARWQADPKNEELRVLARDHAIEWASFRGQVGRDIAPAMSMCVSAAGTEGPCKSRVHDSATEHTVVIVSVPAGATIQLDGKEAGTTPTEVELTNGDHDLRLEIEGRVETRSIPVGTGHPTRWTWSAEQGSWSSAH